MKKKALVVALFCIMGLAVLSVGSAMAVQDTYTVTISDCGANFWDYYTFTATDTNPAGFGTVRFFLVKDPGDTFRKAEYAAALTALANGGKAIIYGDPATTACWELRAAN
jgi:hypothetical protein